MRKALLSWTTASLLLLTVNQHLHAQFSLDLAKTKTAAEQGDAQAQSKLGDAYEASFEYSQAGKWYRTAAEKGVAHAQYRLGDMLLTGRPAMKPGATKVPANPQEAVNWFSRAANQGYPLSQIALGLSYRDGKGVKSDQLEAYKWFSLAAKSSAILGKAYRDQLILKMSSKDIAEGDKKVANFRPNDSSASPYLSMLVLKGITGNPQKRMALINNQTFAAGEEANVKVGTKTLRVKCIEIRDKSAVVKLVETGEQAELVLR